MLKLYKIEDIIDAPVTEVGGKAKSLAMLAKNGFPIPFTICIPTEFYREFVKSEGLEKQLLIEIGRKDFSEMRWEEIWDCSLRIRNLFLRHDIPEELNNLLERSLAELFQDKSVAVRSSAPAEDSSGTSFAGLHESFINVKGVGEIIKHIKLVWASLWSDAALLYRQELKLDIMQSTMAVVVQLVVEGEVSGIAFSQSPNDPETSVIEAVNGLNQGLVDGVIEPDRWFLDRTTGQIRENYIAPKDFYFKTDKQGVKKVKIPKENEDLPVLQANEISIIFNNAMQLENLFSCPQDMEWTIQQGDFFLLQSRPVTTLQNAEGDQERSWYLSLRRSLANLEQLRDKIENELVPKMIKEAEELDYELDNKTADELVDEIKNRKQVFDHWKKIYWDEFIPFAHGIRIFGQFYNDAIKPEDPYEFLSLLQDQPLISLKRNRLLEDMAEMIRNDQILKDSLANGKWPDNPALNKIRQEFEDTAGYVKTDYADSLKLLGKTVLEMALSDFSRRSEFSDSTELEKIYLSHFADENLDEAIKFLDMGRCCYKLRDDDNIYLGRIKKQLFMAVDQAEVLLSEGTGNDALSMLVASCQTESDLHDHVEKTVRDENESDRQITGQPAGPGLVTGVARIIEKQEDFENFKKGEILVCDAIDPNMTFLAPLAGGIIERRGGMLIHGAIIAREYGIACVTGIPQATERIVNGDKVTVDGYLGIVTILRR